MVHPAKLSVEGKYTSLTYSVDDRKDEASGLAVVRNYENALKNIGGTIAASDPHRYVNGSVVVDGKEVWAEAMKGNGMIWLRIIEKQGAVDREDAQRPAAVVQRNGQVTPGVRSRAVDAKAVGLTRRGDDDPEPDPGACDRLGRAGGDLFGDGPSGGDVEDLVEKLLLSDSAHLCVGDLGVAKDEGDLHAVVDSGAGAVPR